MWSFGQRLQWQISHLDAEEVCVGAKAKARSFEIQCETLRYVSGMQAWKIQGDVWTCMQVHIWKLYDMRKTGVALKDKRMWWYRLTSLNIGSAFDGETQSLSISPGALPNLKVLDLRLFFTMNISKLFTQILNRLQKGLHTAMSSFKRRHAACLQKFSAAAGSNISLTQISYMISSNRHRHK